MRRRHRAIPYVAQAERADCGAAALAMALAYHGRHVPLAELHTATGTGRDGTDAQRISEAATTYGMRARGVATELDDLRVLPQRDGGVVDRNDVRTVSVRPSGGGPSIVFRRCPTNVPG